MTGVVRSASDPPQRSTPVALLYIGLPAYLIVIGFSVRDLLQSHEAPAATAGIAMVIAFTAIFFGLAFASYLPPGLHASRVVLIGVMSVLALGLALLEVTSAVYTAAIAAMAGEQLPPRQSVPIILACGALVTVTAVGNDFGPPDVLTQAIIVLVVGLFTFGMRRLAVANDQLVEAREELARLAVLEERVRFARDLHDLLGHSLTVIRAKSELAGRLARTDPDTAAQEMMEVERVAREALGEVRETVSGYRRPTLDGELANARRALAAADITASVDAAIADLPPEIDETLAWVLREMVTNVVRHSAASSCRIATACHDGEYVLDVEDDGRGGDRTVFGNGLSGARERLAIVHGALHVDSDGGGFRVRATVPRPS